MYNILVVDDDKEIVNAIDIYLSKEGYNILKAYDGMEALKIVEKNDNIHLILLDIMMPKLDGISTANLIRKDKSIPIIMLSAKSEDYDKIAGLNNGADDYITKPFNPLELIADKQKEGTTYYSGDLLINDDMKQVTVEGKEIKLTPTEYNILKFLTKNKGIVYSIEQIYKNVWDDECYGAENIIAVHIRHIREKIEINPKEPKYLKVIWGIGYKIENLDK